MKSESVLTLSKIIFYNGNIFTFCNLSEINQTGEILAKHLYNFIVNENLTQVNILSELNDKKIYNKIDIYRSVQNRYRKTRSDKMTNEERSVQQLFRKFNLGNMFGAFDDIKQSDIADFNEFEIQVEGDLTDINLEKKLGSNDELINFKEQQKISIEEDESFMGKGMATENDGNTDEYD